MKTDYKVQKNGYGQMILERCICGSIQFNIIILPHFGIIKIHCKKCDRFKSPFWLSYPKKWIRVEKKRKDVFTEKVFQEERPPYKYKLLKNKKSEKCHGSSQ